MNRESSVALLNQAVADELQAVHQYMYFHFHLSDQGFAPLALLFRQTAIEEMMHVERLAERILFLKGDVVMVAAGPVDALHDPAQMLEKAMAMEESSVADYNKAALECAAAADSATKQVFESLVSDEERHFDQYEKQADNIKRFGPSYLALQSFGSGASGGQPPASE